jgi:hypothetical protein
MVSVMESISLNLKANVSSFNGAMKKVSKNIAAASKDTSKFTQIMAGAEKALLGIGLAALFTGMAIKNAAESALKSFVKTFTEVTEGTMLYNQSIGRLSAAFEFLKFSIADAFLTSTLGQQLLEVVFGILDAFNDLDPSVKAFVFGGLLAVAIFGGLLMIAGQVALAFLAITTTLAILGGLLGLSFAATLGIAVVVALILGIFLLIGLAVLAAKFGAFDLAKAFIAIALVVAGIAAILAVMMGFPLVGIAILAAAFAALIIGFKLGGLQFKLAFLKAIDSIGKAIVFMIIEPINKIIRTINAIAGTRFGQIQMQENAAIADKIRGVEAEIAAQQAAKAEQESDTKGSESKGIRDIIIENLTSNNAEEFVTSLKETSLFNKGAGIG